MNKKLKQDIAQLFEPPSPMKKDKFIKNLDFPKATLTDFIFAQVKYIRKRVWATMSVLLLVALFSQPVIGKQIEQVWIVASLLPFLSLLIVGEISRSDIFMMSEIEMACRFNLSKLVLARMLILCVSSAVFMTVIHGVCLTQIQNEYSFIQFCLYFNAPMLVSTTLNLAVVNLNKTQDTSFISAGVSGAVSIAGLVIFMGQRQLLETNYIAYWAVVALVCVAGIVLGVYKFIKNTEEHRWNLSLIG